MYQEGLNYLVKDSLIQLFQLHKEYWRLLEKHGDPEGNYFYYETGGEFAKFHKQYDHVELIFVSLFKMHNMYNEAAKEIIGKLLRCEHIINSDNLTELLLSNFNPEKIHEENLRYVKSIKTFCRKNN